MTRTHRRTRHGGKEPARSGCGGFTLIELITVLVIMGILSAYIFSRGPSLNGDLAARQSEVRAQLRFLQLSAMKTAVNYISLKCDGTNYWARYSTNSSYIALPGESSTTVSLAGKAMSMGSFTISFDKYGIPYAGDTPVKLTATSSLSITAGGATGTLTVTPETGFTP